MLAENITVRVNTFSVPLLSTVMLVAYLMHTFLHVHGFHTTLAAEREPDWQGNMEPTYTFAAL